MSDNKFQNKYRIPSARAVWHDYSGGMYFITICTAGREHYFGKIEDGEIQLSEIGKFTDECVRKMEHLHSDVFVPLYVIMPNHIHLIVIVDVPIVVTPQCDVSTGGTTVQNQTPDCDVSAYQTPYYDVSTGKNKKMQSIANRCGRLSHVISRFKSAVTRYANDSKIPFKWQERFHDRVIRDQDEYNRIAEYIINNPKNWDKDTYNKSEI